MKDTYIHVRAEQELKERLRKLSQLSNRGNGEPMTDYLSNLINKEWKKKLKKGLVS